MDSIINFLKNAWKDPVGSKVIATGIIGLIALTYAFIKSSLGDITFGAALKGLFDIQVRLVYAIGLFLLYLIGKKIISNKPRSDKYTKKQLKLREYNQELDPLTHILYKWEVRFSNDKPIVSAFVPYCNLHEFTLKMINGIQCPIPKCVNSENAVSHNNNMAIIQSRIQHKWEQLNKK